MEVQFLSKDEKTIYCNDEIIKVTVRQNIFQWNITDVGRAEIRKDMAVFVDNAGAPIIDLVFLPDQKNRLDKIVELVNAQGKAATVPDSAFKALSRVRRKRNMVIASVAIIAIALGVMWYENKQIVDWMNDTYYGQLEYKAKVVRVATHTKNESDALDYMISTTRKLQESGFADKHPNLVVSVTISTAQGELIQSYHGTLRELDDIALNKVQNIDDYLNQLTAAS